MTEDQKNLVLDLALGKLSEDEFLNRYPINVRSDANYIPQMLNEARNKRDATQLECVFILCFHFGCAKEYSGIICQLLQEDWHMQHENIALLLKDLKDPGSVDCLYGAALAKFAYLDYDESHTLGVKCVWALGAIGTEEAKDKLKLLARSGNPVISTNAQRQLARGESR